jgi:hypothetical protein
MISNEYCNGNFGRNYCKMCNEYKSQGEDGELLLLREQDDCEYGNGGRAARTKNNNIGAIGATQTTNQGNNECVKHVDIKRVLKQLG